jgi:hypothetical protein
MGTAAKNALTHLAVLREPWISKHLSVLAERRTLNTSLIFLKPQVELLVALFHVTKSRNSN